MNGPPRFVSAEDDHMISGQDYVLSENNMLMRSKKDQPPPDLRYFGSSRR